jgi:hypothetical protein
MFKARKKKFVSFPEGNVAERAPAPPVEPVVIARTLIDELFERWLLLQQPADADNAQRIQP